MTENEQNKIQNKMDDITENGKYYIPEKSELHEGFICEVKIMQIQKTWEIATVFIAEDGRMWIHTGENGTTYHREKIRVKYLDHDDIISCGWQKVGEEYNCEKYKWPAKIEGESRMLYYDKKIKNVFIDNDMGNVDQHIYFYGKILNISELQFQMARLGIVKHNQYSHG